MGRPHRGRVHRRAHSRRRRGRSVLRPASRRVRRAHADGAPRQDRAPLARCADARASDAAMRRRLGMSHAIGTRPLRRLLPLVLLAWAAVTSAQPSASETEPKQDPPKEHAYSYIYDMLDNSLARPVSRFFDPALLVRRITRNPREAANVDADDQVRLPSTWWQPRLGFRDVSVEQMLNG